LKHYFVDDVRSYQQRRRKYGFCLYFIFVCIESNWKEGVFLYNESYHLWGEVFVGLVTSGENDRTLCSVPRSRHQYPKRKKK